VAEPATRFSAHWPIGRKAKATTLVTIRARWRTPALPP